MNFSQAQDTNFDLLTIQQTSESETISALSAKMQNLKNNIHQSSRTLIVQIESEDCLPVRLILMALAKLIFSDRYQEIIEEK